MSSAQIASTRNRVTELIEDVVRYESASGFVDIGANGLTVNSGDNTLLDIPNDAIAVVHDTSTVPPTPVIVKEFGVTGIADPFRLTNNITFVGVDKNGDIQFKADIPFTNAESRGIALLGVSVHIDNTIIQFTVNRPQILADFAMQDYMRAKGLHKSKLGLNYSGNAGLTLQRSAGSLYGIGLGFTGGTFNYDDPNTRVLASEAVVGAGSTGTLLKVLSNNTATVAGGGGTLLDPTVYESSPGVLTPLSNNTKWSVQVLVSFSEGRTNVQYGQQEYDNMTDAVNAIDTLIDDYTFAPVVLGSALPLAAIAMQKTCLLTNNPVTCVIKNFGRDGVFG